MTGRNISLQSFWHNKYIQNILIMKKILIAIAISLISACAFAQTVQIQLDQKVKRREAREQVWVGSNDIKKDVFRQKTFTCKVSSTKPAKVFAILCIYAGGNISAQVFDGAITMQKPFVFSDTAEASSSTTKIDFKYIEDYKSKIGDDKVEACVFVYAKNGKFLGSKYTSKALMDDLAKYFKDDIAQIIQRNKE